MWAQVTSKSRRRGLPRPDRCPATSKVRWPVSKSAVAVLHMAKNQASAAAERGEQSRRRETRHYKCAHCHGFHTTSQPQIAA